jgi:hypothetical protein
VVQAAERQSVGDDGLAFGMRVWQDVSRIEELPVPEPGRPRSAISALIVVLYRPPSPMT